MGVLACGANLFGQLIANSDPILCCPTDVIHMKDAQTAHITFTHVFLKTEKCWKGFGFENSFLSDINTVDVKWKVSVSENKIAAINDRNDIIILEEGKSWRSIHMQPITPLEEEEEANNIVYSLPDKKDINSDAFISRISCKDQKGNENIHITESVNNIKKKGRNQELKSEFIKVLVDNKNLLALDEDGQLYSGCIHVPLPGIQIADICIGAESYIALTKNGDVLTWGSGMRGQLGNESLQACEEPQIVESLCGLGIVQVAAGAWHCAALSKTGDVYMWGWNESGQLGFLSKTLQENSQFPSHHHKCICKNSAKHTKFKNTQTSTEDSFIEALTNDNLHLVNNERSIEVINVQMSPKLLDFWQEDVNITHVACGDRHTIFSLDNGSTWAVGMNKYGQLGIGDTCSRDSPVCIPVLGVEKVIAGAWNTLLITKN
ncbi:unnamed protein product [Meganyctiphanes norvegica]|uniref:RCC1 domain-containing protein 1 n=1 Tax=Meganyctiphanes norvegica TaxID=48144 RepID=A0AAV2SB06_MEGNR